LHNKQIQNRTIRTETEIGGYATHPQYYEETRYYDEKSGLLLSRIQRERNESAAIHLIEVNVYDAKDVLQRDYLAVYLPVFRNAPIQTLINLHTYNKGLHAFRQFDASGDYIYEQCQGKYQGKDVLLSLDEDQFSPGAGQKKSVVRSKLYKMCFNDLPKVIDNAIMLRSSARPGVLSMLDQEIDADKIDSQVAHYTRLLEQQPTHTGNLLARGNLYFAMHDFDLAILDYSEALRIDKTLDEAYFARGMALARNGQIKEGIADMTIYIGKHPDSSVAYTKRGVRYLWQGDDKLAQADFERAIALDPANAEAHDDLGVILARQGDHRAALAHFEKTVSLDASYFKGYHNLAMVYYITGQDTKALDAIDKVLKLAPSRDSMLLKAEILTRLGGTAEATRLRQEAEFMPEGNWSERLSVQ
jgi:tetratricopeptide (TPR) repeat protein